MAEAAPVFYEGDDPADYILQVAEYLAEPDRRRLGTGTEAYVREAVLQLRLLPLREALQVAAEFPIEEYPRWVFKEIEETLNDLLSRIEGQPN